MKHINLFKKVAIYGLILFAFNIQTSWANKELINIKLAIIDNFHFQPNFNNQFDLYYKPGIELAKIQARKMGYKVHVKYFIYGQEPLSVFEAIPRAKAWKPDVIIGPRNSNTFLLLKEAFQGILVLSPYATSDSVSSMPKNFYSLAFPDKIFSNSIENYLEENFKKIKIFGIIQADCKNCMDIADNFKKNYEKKRKDKITYTYFSQLDEKNIDIKKLLLGYEKGSIIFIPDYAYYASILMPQITNYLKRPVLFVGADDWGSWLNTPVGKVAADYPYKGLRFTPWSYDEKSIEMKNFMNEYQNAFHKGPEDVATYMSYNAAISFIFALHHYENNPSIKKTFIIRKKILKSYQLALKKNPNWHRKKRYAVYSVSPDGTQYVGVTKVKI